MCDVTKKMNEAVAEYAEMRAAKLLQETPFNFGELRLKISEEVSASVGRGINGYAEDLLTTGHIKLDKNMRMVRVDDDI
jgi:hypothetical protein